MSRAFKRVAGVFGVLLLLAVPFIVFWQQQFIYDWWKLRNYRPTERVAQMATATTMNDYARKVFYVNDPKIENKADFNVNCNGGEQTIVLGCYVSHNGIFIYDVKDERLKGIHEVTAAHEVLHAIYERHSAKQKSEVNRMVTTAFNAIKNDRLAKTIEQYRQKDPNIVPNELHSILGTEIRVLPAELETYYSRYFNDRQKIVSLSEQYEKTFTEREAKIAEYDAKLAALKTEIEAGEASLHSQLTVLQTQKGQLDAAIARNDIKSYNAAIPGYNAKVVAYNNLLNQVRLKIDTYNKLVTERNIIAAEEKTLVEAIDSRLPTAQKESK